jgi:surface antigen
MKRIQIFTCLVFLILLSCVQALAQESSGLNDPALTKFQIVEAKASTETLERRADDESLSAVVQRRFPKAILIQETLADSGRQAVTFRLAKKEGVIDAILIDYGTHLQLHKDELKLRQKENGKNGDGDVTATEPTLALATSTSNPYTNNCSGVTRTPGNPYPCCNTYYQNCTYFAWEQAYRFWGDALPSAGNARDWAANLSAKGYPVASTSGPGLYNIGVNSTLASGVGHVAWTMEISNNMVLVWEQSCGVNTNGFSQTWRSIATFNRGFVQTKKALPSPYVNGHSPQNLVSSGSLQPVVFWGGNFNAGLRAVVTFPSGGRTTLKDSALRPEYASVTANMVLGSPGWWSIQIFNENGKYSGMYYFYVN